MKKRQKNPNKKAQSGIVPVIIGVVVIVVVVAAILITATWSQRVKEQQDLIIATEQSEGDGELSDYEAPNYIKLADYSEFSISDEDEEAIEEEEDTSEDDKLAEKKSAMWDNYVAACTIDSYPDDLVEEAVYDTKKQYENFAYVTGETYEDLLESYGMDEETVTDVSKDTVLSRMIAKTIAYREGLSLDDELTEKYLLVLTSYEEGEEKESYEELVKDYMENYSGRYLDDCYVELVKEWLYGRM